MAAYEIPGFSFTLPAAVDFSALGQFRFVDVNSSGQATSAGAAADAIGVRQNTPTAVGEATTVVTSGIVMVEASAAIVVGATIASAADGKAVTAVSTNPALGTALTAAGGDGELVSVLLAGPGPHTLVA